jgi:hypothetical protein
MVSQIDTISLLEKGLDVRSLVVQHCYIEVARMYMVRHSYHNLQ